ncbi:protein kinase domain-containing protein [Streptomyces sp. URMC 129]|uniref:protein kinase domain-containing protein n=1 Tax=Streptomyces sp. URMC 129 TaxID=3423407 RepID=UPI003F1D3B0D
MGHYRLLGKLGAGGMGSVYLARSDRGRTVAVKLVQPELAAQPEFRRRFQQEVEAARAVGGDWTAPVLGCDTEAETPWVATGYVAGPSLHEVVAQTYGRLPERTLRILANGLVRALKDIHAAGLVHRDLKPSNVMITIDGPRVIDFGIARALEGSGDGLTRTGAAVGSPGFMSPEQCRGEVLTAASDIFCLGSVLTFAATGRTPFGDANTAMTALMLRIVQGQQDLTEVPEGLRPLIERCLAQHPADRPSLDELLELTASPEDDEEPWLPGALIAKLGRHAVELLDSEDPLQAPPIPLGKPAPAMPAVAPTPLPPTAIPTPPPPAAAPPTPTQLSVPGTPPPSPPPNSGVDAMATMTSAVPPPGWGTPPPPSTGGWGTPPPPGAGGYGYPQAGTPGYGYPQAATPEVGGPYGPAYPGGPGGPGGPGAPGGAGKKKNLALIIVAAVAVFAIAAGVAVFALGGDSDDEAGDGGTETTQPTDDPGNDPTGDPTDDPTDAPTGGPTDQPTEPAEDPEIDPSATVGTEYVGAWEGPVLNEDGDEVGFFQRIEIDSGYGGDTVATQWTVLNEVLCEEQAQLVSSDGGLTLNGTGVTAASPDGATCNPYQSQTLEMNGSTLLWTSGQWHAELTSAEMQSDSDGMPYDIHSQTYTGSGYSIQTETTSYAGSLALTWSDGSCTWESAMISGGLEASSILVGPGRVTSGNCDPLPSYRLEWTPADDKADTITFTPYAGDGGGSFDANREAY